MIMKTKKWSLTLGFAFLFTIALGTANAGIWSSSCDCDQTQWDCCEDATHLCAVTPCCKECGFFGGGEFLYWTTYQTDMDYAVDVILGNLPTFGPRTHIVDYDWDTGFRAMAGYLSDCDGWDVKRHRKVSP